MKLFDIKLKLITTQSYVFLNKYFHSFLFNAADTIKKKRVRIVKKIICIDIFKVVFEKLINLLIISINWDEIMPAKVFNDIAFNKHPKKIIKMGKDKIFIEKNGRLLNLINLYDHVNKGMLNA